jgi:hypothetical protein
MKAIFPVMVGTFLLILFQCGTEKGYEKTVEDQSLGIKVNYPNIPYNCSGGVSLIIIDSCEYVVVHQGNASWGSHKGNCKYCAARAAQRDSILVSRIANR